jgi:HlyD family secretion protein
MTSRNDSLDFAPDLLRVQKKAPSPLPRAMLYLLLALLGTMIAWAFVGRLDVVATAQGKIVPQGYLKILQPAEPGIVREILVKDGDAVALGQTLIRMDTRISDADRRVIENDLSMRGLQLRRIDAELSDTPLARTSGDDPELFAQVDAQYRARKRAYRDALDSEAALLAKAQQDLQVAQVIESKLKKTVPIYRTQAESWNKLAREGYAGRLMALERQRLYVESAQDLRAQAHSIESLRASVAQSSTRLAQITSNYRQQLHDERVEAEAQRHRAQQELDKQQHRSGLLELKAPQASIVKDLATHTPGTVVAPGAILLTLVPRNEPLVAEVWIDNADAGFVLPDQKTRLKLPAFPFQKYGMLEGTVQHISADAQEQSDEPGTAQPYHGAAYRALIALDADHLARDGNKLRLRPGMLVSAEIHLGTRSVIEYLLSPVQKIAHEAGRER